MTGIFYDTKEMEMILQEHEDGTMTYDRSWMIQELQKRVCRVIFTKVNGEERDMQCTLMESALTTAGDKHDPKRQRNEDTIAVWDTLKCEWRSFRVDRVVSFT